MPFLTIINGQESLTVKMTSILKIIKSVLKTRRNTIITSVNKRKSNNFQTMFKSEENPNFHF